MLKIHDSRLKFTLLFLLLLTAIIAPLLISEYWTYVFVLVYYYTVMAVSWNFLAGYTGQFSLAHHSFALIGSYTSTLLVTKTSMPLGIGILSGIALTIIISFLIGVICLRVKGIYLALITWSFAEIVRTYIRMDFEFTGGDRGLAAPLLFGTINPTLYYYLFLCISIFTIIVIAILMNSRIGYYLRAIRNDEVAARSMGVNIVKWKIFAFTLASGFAGMAGVFYGHFIGLISPVSGEFSEISMIIIFVVIGGMRTQSGPVVGAVLIRFLMEVLQGWAAYRMIILSAIVILIMRFFNGGLMEFFEQVKLWFQKAVSKEVSSATVSSELYVKDK